MFRIQLWWGEKKRQHSDGFVVSPAEVTLSSSVFAPRKEELTDSSHIIAQMGEYFSVIYLYVAKSTPPEVTGRGQGEYAKN